MRTTHVWPRMEPTLIIMPRLRDAMWGTTAFDMRTMEKTLVSYICCHKSMGMSIIAPVFRVK